MRGNNVFQFLPVQDVGYKINALDFCNENLFVGDSSGKLYKYIINTKNAADMVEGEISEKVSKNKIDAIKFVPINGRLLVLADSTLFEVDSFLKKSGEPIFKNCVSFCINEAAKTTSEICAITKKREMLFFKWNVRNSIWEEFSIPIIIPDYPVSLSWAGNSIICGFPKKDYMLVRIDKGEISTLPIPVGVNSIAKAIELDEFLVFATNNIGIFISADGSIKPKSNISLTDKSKAISNVVAYPPYILVLSENILNVFSTNDSKLLQESVINSTSVAKNIIFNDGSAFLCTLNEIILLVLTPFQAQIKKFLFQGQVEEAFTIFSQNVSNLDPERPKLLEQLRLDSAWSHFKDLKFGSAKSMFVEANGDPRELIGLFPDYLPTLKRNSISNANQKKFLTMSLIINDALQSKFQGTSKKNDLNTQLTASLKESKLSLAEILESKRSLLLTTFPNKSEFITFSFSELSPNNATYPKSNVMDLLEIMDFTLIKIYIEFCMEDRLESLFAKEPLHCISLQLELETAFSSQKLISSKILAKFFQAIGKYKESLELWRVEARKDPKIACFEAGNLVCTITNKALALENLKWILNISPETSTKIFANIKESLVSPDEFLAFFKEFETKLGLTLKEKYLEVIVYEKKSEEERFHTNLALFYTEQLFKLFPKENHIITLDKEDPSYPMINKYRSKLSDLLKAQNGKYRASTVLEYLKNSWLFDEEIFLYGKERMHKNALKKMVENDCFEMAEIYCAEKNEKLLTKLFKVYIDVYDMLQKQVAKNPSGEQERALRFAMRSRINDFLQKYSCHPEVEPLKVLEMIPSEWMLTDKGTDQGLFYFLKSLVSHLTHEKRIAKVKKNLAEINLLKTECDLAKAQKAQLKVTVEKSCSICTRKISDKYFVVFPNGVTAHHTCIGTNGLTVCPQTGQDFEKTGML